MVYLPLPRLRLARTAFSTAPQELPRSGAMSSRLDGEADCIQKVPLSFILLALVLDFFVLFFFGVFFVEFLSGYGPLIQEPGRKVPVGLRQSIRIVNKRFLFVWNIDNKIILTIKQ